jgi:hypothetical protein
VTRHLIFGLLALTLAGCGVHDPYNDKPAAADDRAPADAATSRRHDADANSDEQPPRDATDPDSLASPPIRAHAGAEEIASAYGLAQTNWSWRTYEDQYERMTGLAGGALARDLRANPPEPDQLHGIRADRQTNRSSAIAVDSRLLSPTRTRVIVVYEELAGGAGVTDTAPRHTVYRAVVSRLREGWRVTQWSLLP